MNTRITDHLMECVKDQVCNYPSKLARSECHRIFITLYLHATFFYSPILQINHIYEERRLYHASEWNEIEW